jgi:hypothetical protein
VQWVVSTIMSTLQRLFAASWGPRLEHVLSHTLWTAMTIKDSTLVEVLLLLTDPLYRHRRTENLKEPLLDNFWNDFPKSDIERHELVASTVNKLTPFLLAPNMRNIVGQAHSTVKIREVMDERKILMVNLSKGDLGENNSSLLGSVLINLILIAALSRRNMTPEERQERQFHVIVDEYQNFASESFSVLQSEARKYAVDLVVAHQYRDQLDEVSQGAALNVGNFVCFRVTGVDSEVLARQFDNKPPEPDVRYETLKRPSPTTRGIYLNEPNAYVEVEQPRRMYSDVAAERANTLANIAPFQALMKLMEEYRDEEENPRFKLAEHTIQAFDPRKERHLPFFGTRDEEQAARIKERSRQMADPREAVERRFNKRTEGRARFAIPPESGEE